MLYTEGNLTAEDRLLRGIARTKVRTALQAIEQKTTRMVDDLVGKLDAHINQNFTTEQLLDAITMHPQTCAESELIERYRTAFPELAEVIAQAHERTREQARRRIEQARAPFEFSRRFSVTKRLNVH